MSEMPPPDAERVDQIQALAGRIVEAIARRSEQDPGMSLDQVQSLLVARVRSEAEAHGVRPRELMGYVWRAWEAHNKPPLLGPTEVERVMRRLVEKGLVRLVERPGAEAQLVWTGGSETDLTEKMADLDHEERLFVQAIIRHLRARAGLAP